MPGFFRTGSTGLYVGLGSGLRAEIFGFWVDGKVDKSVGLENGAGHE